MNINFDNSILERFIPIDFTELKENLQAENIINAKDLETFADALSLALHQTYYKQMLATKENYKHFNPDRDTVSIKKYSDEVLKAYENEFNQEMISLLDNANYEKLTQEDLNKAINEKSPYGVEVSVDLSAFEYIELFFRGSAVKSEKRRDIKTLFLKKEVVATKVYKRLFILFKLKENTQQVSLKLFKNIPSNDLEMLFPNTKVKMTLFDKLKLAVTGGGGTIGGVVTLVGKIAVLVDPIAILIAIAAFVGILWRQVSSVFNNRVKYMAKLAQNLYFYNLDNNAGVISYLADMAENEELKEAFLAYIFLLKSSQDMTLMQLDNTIEAYIQNTYKVPMDFEIDDAMSKLEKLRLVSKNEDLYRALPIKEALQILEKK
ncbi:MAG: DUF3754 domain-containing protein [Sulfurimonas sp.]